MPRRDGNGPWRKGPGYGRGGGVFSRGGRGRGGGRDMARGMDNRRSQDFWMENPGHPMSYNPERGPFFDNDPAMEDAAQLKEQARQMQKELDSIRKRFNELGGTGQATARVCVDMERCTGCRRCANVCPRDAITVGSVAQIDHDRCTLCGRCVEECPARALRIG